MDEVACGLSSGNYGTVTMAEALAVAPTASIEVPEMPADIASGAGVRATAKSDQTLRDIATRSVDHIAGPSTATLGQSSPFTSDDLHALDAITVVPAGGACHLAQPMHSTVSTGLLAKATANDTITVTLANARRVMKSETRHTDGATSAGQAGQGNDGTKTTGPRTTTAQPKQIKKLPLRDDVNNGANRSDAKQHVGAAAVATSSFAPLGMSRLGQRAPWSDMSNAAAGCQSLYVQQLPVAGTFNNLLPNAGTAAMLTSSQHALKMQQLESLVKAKMKETTTQRRCMRCMKTFASIELQLAHIDPDHGTPCGIQPGTSGGGTWDECSWNIAETSVEAEAWGLGGMTGLKQANSELNLPNVLTPGSLAARVETAQHNGRSSFSGVHKVRSPRARSSGVLGAQKHQPHRLQKPKPNDATDAMVNLLLAQPAKPSVQNGLQAKRRASLPQESPKVIPVNMSKKPRKSYSLADGKTSFYDKKMEQEDRLQEGELHFDSCVGPSRKRKVTRGESPGPVDPLVDTPIKTCAVHDPPIKTCAVHGCHKSFKDPQKLLAHLREHTEEELTKSIAMLTDKARPSKGAGRGTGRGGVRGAIRGKGSGRGGSRGASKGAGAGSGTEKSGSDGEYVPNKVDAAPVARPNGKRLRSESRSEPLQEPAEVASEPKRRVKTAVLGGITTRGQAEDAKPETKPGKGAASNQDTKPSTTTSAKLPPGKRLCKQEQLAMLRNRDSPLAVMPLSKVVSVDAWDQLTEEEQESLLPLLLPEDRDRASLEQLLTFSPQLAETMRDWQDMLLQGEYDPDVADIVQMKRALQGTTRTSRYNARYQTGLGLEDQWTEMNQLMRNCSEIGKTEGGSSDDATQAGVKAGPVVHCEAAEGRLGMAPGRQLFEAGAEQLQRGELAR